MTHGTRHTTAVGRLGDLNPKLKRFGCHIRLQVPATLPPFDEPEPDGAIVKGDDKRYVDRHPGAGDVLCVIEVADASLRRDRGYKQGIYADSGVAQYIIINLPDDVVEVYTQPIRGKGRYGQVETLSAKQVVSFNVGRGKTLKSPVRRLLP